MSVELAVMEITPLIATEMLGGNLNNRNLRKTRVEGYARDMKSGLWRVNGDAIRFNGGGDIVDGQHRLHACILANKSFTTVVVRGLTKADHGTIDVGLNRSMADELKYRGEKDYAVLAAMLRLVWGYDNDNWHTPPTRHEQLRILNKQPEIRDSIRVKYVGTKLAIRGTALATAHFLAGRDHDTEAANDWIDWLAAGVDYGEGDPCLALRNYATNAAAKAMMRPNTEEYLAVSIKAFNLWAEGRAVNRLRWARAGRARESFPRIISPDEL